MGVFFVVFFEEISFWDLLENHGAREGLDHVLF